jgi:hyaluronan synthase/N-acetylglucosaminyltransferase
MQIGTSIIERKRVNRNQKLPKASLIVAAYNEPIELFIAAAKSFKALDYPDLEVIIVDDGSENHQNIEKISRHLGFTYVYQANAGKREAMYTGFKYMHPKSEVVLTADSDTLWEPNAAKELVLTLLDDDKTGAVTGEVAVLNEHDNLLTKLIGMRYHIAFLHERASQSYFRSVTCVSGPLGAYRREVIEAIKDDFVGQRFMGKACTYGDDRHLTNLVLNQGKQVRYAAGARCLTYAPTEFWTLVKQQTRWSKSYWREIFWQLRVIPKHGAYRAYDWIISFALPFLLLLAIADHLLEIGAGNHMHIWLLPLTIVGMSLVRIIEPMWRTRRPAFLLFALYAFIYFAVMLPSKFWALATINDGKWGTR